MEGTRHKGRVYARANSARSTMGRRSFLQFLAAEAALRGATANPIYQVGAGSSSDPYTATMRAIRASEQWPVAAISGKTVIIKPNLVSPLPSTSGATTDPQVVRAIVDMALYAGASRVSIVEDPPLGKTAYWSACGYDVVFNNYNPQVELVDLRNDPFISVPVPGGYAYQSVWLPARVMDPNVVFISAAKMKTHVNATVTLSIKNLVGLAQQEAYQLAGPLARQDMHYRGIDLSAVDLLLARPIHFSVIDGIWGMEGNGPIQGIPVSMNLVLAGRNPLAVDRVALAAMRVSQNAVPHLSYATLKGQGAADLSKVRVVGDSFSSYAFTPANTGPIIWHPTITPASFSLGAGGQATFSFQLQQPCQLLVQIIQDSDTSPAVDPVCTVQDWTETSSPTQSFVWRGVDNTGALVAPGQYLARAMARYTPTSRPVTYSTTRIQITA
jgi:uncharacterized protein (DUF362 family)